MSSSELDPSVERAIVSVQHFFGSIFIVFNGSILVLIIRDEDKRNKNYHKYLCCLQIFSLAFDSLSDFYSPIVMTHKGAVYSDSLLANYVSVAQFLAVDLIMYTHVFLSYFACVYYRRGVVLYERHRFNYFGWKRIVLYLALEIYVIVTMAVTSYLLRSSQYSELALSEELLWVKQRKSHYFLQLNANIFYASLAADQFATIIGFAILAMLWQIIIELKRGTRKASNATRRYQQLAVRSLILQGAVPGLVYLIPSFLNTCLQVAPTVFTVDAKFDGVAAIMSPCLWTVMTTHTFANSFTMLYCSSAYRRRIKAGLQSILRQLWCTMQVSPLHSQELVASTTYK